MKKITLLSFITLFLTTFLITFIFNWTNDGYSLTVLKFSLLNSLFFSISATINLFIIYNLLQKQNIYIIFIITFLIIFTSSIIGLIIFYLSESIFVLLRRNFFAHSVTGNLVMSLSITIIQNMIFFFMNKINLNNKIIIEERTLRKEIEYKSLLAKLNPHFLFNALNTLVSISKDSNKIEKSLIDLSEILRYSLDSDNLKFVMLSDEIEIIKKYIAFQRLRFGDIISLVTEISEDFIILPFIIQPLVENSIKHNRITDGLTIFIKAYSDKEYRYIEVYDSALKLTEDMPGKGTGLKITKTRIENASGSFTIYDGKILIKLRIENQGEVDEI